MREYRASPAAVVGLYVALFALTAQLLGAVLVLLTPFDNQGAVGKAFVALGASVLAYPAAALGLILCAASWRRGSLAPAAKRGLAAGLLALIPFALGAVQACIRWHISV